MFKYYLKRIGNNQTVHISQRAWIILNLDRALEVCNLTPTDFISHIKEVFLSFF
jgi:hypothetical protein